MYKFLSGPYDDFIDSEFVSLKQFQHFGWTFHSFCFHLISLKVVSLWQLWYNPVLAPAALLHKLIFQKQRKKKGNKIRLIFFKFIMLYIQILKDPFLRCIHHFKSDLIHNMDHMRILGTKLSSIIVSQTKWCPIMYMYVQILILVFRMVNTS